MRALVLAVVIVVLGVPAVAAALPPGSTFLVSRPAGFGPVGAPFDADSNGPIAVSDGGRYVAFASSAPGFAAGTGPSQTQQVLLRDTQANTTTLVSRSDGADGAVANAPISSPGTNRIAIAIADPGAVLDPPADRPHVLVAFTTKATNLVDHATGTIPPTGGATEVWVRDVTAGTTRLVSRRSGADGVPAGGIGGGAGAAEPALVATPASVYVAFSAGDNSLGGHTDRDIYLRDLASQDTRPVSCHARNCAATAAAPGAFSSSPSIAYAADPAGTPCAVRCVLVAFETTDPTLAPTASGFTQLVVATANYAANSRPALQQFSAWRDLTPKFGSTTTGGGGDSSGPQLTPDGRVVGFRSSAPDLTDHRIDRSGLGYVTSSSGTGTHVLTTGSVYNGWPIDSLAAAGHGTHAYVTSTAVQLVPAQTDANVHVFLLADASPPVLVDDDAAGVPGNAYATDFAISPDGGTVAFASPAANLDPGRDFSRVFLRRVATGERQLVSRPDGGSGPFATPGNTEARITARAVSADGRYVAFTSAAHDLSAEDDDLRQHVYVRDTVTGTTTLADRADGPGGAVGTDDATLGGISDDGRRVAFTSAARNLGPTGGGFAAHAFVRDLDAQRTVLVSRVNGPTGSAAASSSVAISGDGRHVAFTTGMQLDPAGGSLYVRDLDHDTTTLVDRRNGPLGAGADRSADLFALDDDGDRVVWSTQSGLDDPAASGTAREHVWLRDLSAGTTTLVSRADGAGGAQANADAGLISGTADALAIAGDGNTVVFASAATNLGADPQGHGQLWARHLDTAKNELVSRAPGAAGAVADQPAGGASVDRAGDRVAFFTTATNLGVPADHGNAWVRDLGDGSLTLVNRVDGPAGAPAAHNVHSNPDVSLSANGDCAVFSADGPDFGDEYANPVLASVHLRVLRNACGPERREGPLPPAPPGDGPGPGAAGPPPAGAPPSAGPVRRASRTVLTNLRLRPASFAVRRGRKGGTRISFGLDRAARVTLTIERRLTGHRIGRARTRRCSTATRVRGRACVTYKKAGTVTVARARAGLTTVVFTGRIKARSLPAGRYRLIATTADGARMTVTFRIVRARR